MSDGSFYDVQVLLPVTVRVWAESEADARQKYARIPLQVSAQMGHSVCVGFPETMQVSEVTTDLKLVNKE